MKIIDRKLKNSLRVVIAEDKVVKDFFANFYFFVGSRNEKAGEQGITHVTEHMIKYGSKKYPTLAKDLEKRGISFYGITDFEYTRFTLFGQKDKSSEILKGISDFVLSPVFDETKFLKERDVVWQEVIDDQSQVKDFYNKVDELYGKSLFAFPPGGMPEFIEKIDFLTMEKFFKDSYLNSSKVLFIATDKISDKLISKVDMIFESMKLSLAQLSAQPFPSIGGAKKEIIHEDGRLAEIEYLFKIPAVTNKDYFPLIVACRCLEQTLYERLRVENSLLYDIGLYKKFLRDNGYVRIITSCKKDKLPRVLLEIDDILNSGKGLTEKLGRVKDDIVEGVKNGPRDANHVMSFIGSQLIAGVNRLNDFDKESVKIKDVTANDITRVVKKYFSLHNRDCFVGIKAKD